MEEEKTDPGICIARPKRLVENLVSACYVPGEVGLLNLSRLRYLVVHMCSFKALAKENPNPIADELLDAPSMSERQRQDPNIAHPAYHVVVKLDGTVQQCLPLSRHGSHARAYNSESLAICIVGEGEPAEMTQLGPAGEVAALLHMFASSSSDNSHAVDVVGHTELPDASRDRTKRCPWPRVTMDQFRGLVRSKLPSGWQTLSKPEVRELVVEAGLVI